MKRESRRKNSRKRTKNILIKLKAAGLNSAANGFLQERQSTKFPTSLALSNASST